MRFECVASMAILSGSALRIVRRVHEMRDLYEVDPEAAIAATITTAMDDIMPQSSWMRQAYIDCESHLFEEMVMALPVPPVPAHRHLFMSGWKRP